MMIPTRLAVLFAAMSVAPVAQAATLSYGPLPPAAVANPLAVSTTGTVHQNVTFDRPRFDNPWTVPDPVTGVETPGPTDLYTGVSQNGSATYRFDLSVAASFVWGSLDSVNRVEFLRGTKVVDSYTPVDGRRGLPDIYRGGRSFLATFTGITGGAFDGIRFSTGDFAFEFANLTVTAAPVPLPACGALLLGALGGLVVLRRRKGA